MVLAPRAVPLGASLGVVTAEDRLFVTLRYWHPLFDAGAAAEFLSTFKQVLT